jgi:GT2 family glycosyltransferase
VTPRDPIASDHTQGVDGRRVAVVTVTHNRRLQLEQTLTAIGAQSHRPEMVIVVDSGSSDGTAAYVREQWPGVVLIDFVDNVGPAAGRGAGMTRSVEADMDRIWLVDDDSPPAPNALERLLTADGTLRDVGMLGLAGGEVRWGRISHDPGFGRRVRPPGSVTTADFVILDGALVRSAAVRDGGVPRDDYFIMMEDVEYPLRLQAAGFQNYVLAEDVVEFGHMGSVGEGAGEWRAYYQARNYVRMAHDLKRPSLLFGAFLRELHYVVVLVGRPRGWTRLRLRWRGVRDGLAGRMGRTVEPTPRGNSTV